jgi:uncharacterized protein YecE (DUF72 family)
VIYIGTCGFAYKDWIGPFYPAKIKSAEMLPYYASRFRAVEIDASYYGVPAASTIAGMHARTPDEFRFSFKAPQTVTHPPDDSARVHDDAQLLRERLEPLAAHGKLAAILIQFPNAFKPGERAQHYLRAVVAAFGELPLVAEFRNRDWQTEATLEMLRELCIGLCNVDLPSYDTLPAPSADATSRVGYVRFHGRNAAQWWSGDNVTRYDYSYAAGELLPWSDRIADLESQTDETHVFFNNHAEGQAAGNAEMIEALLEERYGDAAGDVLALPAAPPPMQTELGL